MCFFETNCLYLHQKFVHKSVVNGQKFVHKSVSDSQKFMHKSVTYGKKSLSTIIRMEE